MLEIRYHFYYLQTSSDTCSLMQFFLFFEPSLNLKVHSLDLFPPPPSLYVYLYLVSFVETLCCMLHDAQVCLLIYNICYILY